VSAAAWSPPEHCPPAGGLSGNGRVLRLRDPHVDIPRLMPAPLLQSEVELWVRPAASVAFPVHPAGVTVLYDRAQRILAAVAAATQLEVVERPTLNRELWRIASTVYAPGAGVRSAMDRVVEERAVRPNLTGVVGDDERLRLMQLAHLASWAVLRAAADWCQDSK
jgi:hypothetical protein